MTTQVAPIAVIGVIVIPWLLRSNPLVVKQVLDLNMKMFLLGFSIAWPVKAVLNGLPILAEDTFVVALAVLMTAFGNLWGVPWYPKQGKVIKAGLMVGLVGLATAMGGGFWVIAAAFITSGSFAASSSVLRKIDTDMSSLTNGMITAAVVTSWVVFVTDNVYIYTIVTIVIGAFGLLIRPPVPEPDPESSEDLLEAEPLVRTWRDYGPHVLHFVFRAATLAMFAVLPQVVDEFYKEAVAVMNVGIAVGFLLSNIKNSAYIALTLAALLIVASKEPSPVVRLGLIFSFAILAGEARAVLSDRVAHQTPDLATSFRVIGEFGEVVGAIAICATF